MLRWYKYSRFQNEWLVINQKRMGTSSEVHMFIQKIGVRRSRLLCTLLIFVMIIYLVFDYDVLTMSSPHLVSLSEVTLSRSKSFILSYVFHSTGTS